MTRRPFPWPLPLLLLLAGAAAVLAAPARWYQAANLAGDCLVESHDPLFNDNALGVVDRFAGELVPATPARPGASASRLLLRLETQDPAVLPQAPFLFLRDGGGGPRPDFQVTAFVGPRNPPEGWLRQVVAALLYRRAVAQGATFYRQGDLPPLPLWLTEGAFQTLLDGSADVSSTLNREIVARARFLGKTPSLETVLGWQDLGADPLLRPWQEAFCWEVYLFYKSDPARSAQLDGWFQSLGGTHPAAWTLDPTVEEQWKAFQKTAGEEGAVLYSWDRTATAFAALQTFALPAVGTAPARVVKWADLPLLQSHPAFPAALEDKIAHLILLEMQADFSWRPVIGLYRDALSTLRAPKDTAAFPARLALAESAAQRLSGLSQRVGDYLNWFEVTRSTGGRGSEIGSAFGSYFDLSGQFEAWEEAGRAAPSRSDRE